MKKQKKSDKIKENGEKLMEDIIKEKLCNFCMNKCENCMEYKENKYNKLLVYQCENYNQNIDKIKGYDEKWIDNTLINLEINKYK